MIEGSYLKPPQLGDVARELCSEQVRALQPLLHFLAWKVETMARITSRT